MKRLGWVLLLASAGYLARSLDDLAAALAPHKDYTVPPAAARASVCPCPCLSPRSSAAPAGSAMLLAQRRSERRVLLPPATDGATATSTGWFVRDLLRLFGAGVPHRPCDLLRRALRSSVPEASTDESLPGELAGESMLEMAERSSQARCRLNTFGYSCSMVGTCFEQNPTKGYSLSRR